MYGLFTVLQSSTVAWCSLCQQPARARWENDRSPSGECRALQTCIRCRALAPVHRCAGCARLQQPLHARRCCTAQHADGGGSCSRARRRRPRAAHARAVVPKSMARMALRFCAYAMRRRSSSVLEHTILPLADAASTPPELRAQTHILLYFNED